MNELPVGWALATIPELFELNPRKPPLDVVPPDTLVSFVPMAAVEAVSGTITQPETKKFSAVRNGYTAFREGDVLLAKITPCFENGKAAIARELTSGIGFGSSEFHVFRPTGAVLAEYLFHYLRQQKFRQEAAEHMTGTAGQARVPADYLKTLDLPVPPLLEQHRIVAQIEALLVQVDAVREHLEKVPGILRRFRQAVLSAACSGELTQDWRELHPDATVDLPSDNTDPAQHVARRTRRGANLSLAGELILDEEMPDLPSTWRYQRADALVADGTVITYGIVLPGPEVPGGVAYVRQKDIERTGIRLDQLRHTSQEIAARHTRSQLSAGDVLLCIIRNLRVAVVPRQLEGANITQGMVRLRPSRRILGAYMAAYLSSIYAQGWMKRRYFGMDMPRINVEDARAVPVALPPVEEQEEILRRLDLQLAVADRIETAVDRAALHVHRVVEAIAQKAFQGELTPTEAELAAAEGRSYESAPALLERIEVARQKLREENEESRRGSAQVRRGRRRVTA